MLPDIRPILPEQPTAVTEEVVAAALPAVATLAPAYPNPFNASVTIPFALPAGGPIRVVVTNSAGQVVRVLWDRPADAGTHQLQWDGRDEAGHGVGSGLYLVRMRAGSTEVAQKVTLLK
jgi:hypothetical protein